MKKPNIKRLRYPWWFRILFFLLTVIGPMIVIMIEGYKAPHVAFKCTFGIITSLVILWAFVNHFVIKRVIKDARERQVKLEHDYEIDVGDAKKIKWLWFGYEQKLAIFDACGVGLCGGLLVLISSAVASQLMAIEGAIIMIAIFYVVAYMLKFILITIMKGGVEDEPTE